MRLIVGLGNPGPEYAWTRHNIGFIVADNLREEGGFPDWKSRASALFSKKAETVLLKPQTYMNLSGKAVLSAVSFYKPDEVIVVHDDLDLKTGTWRDKVGGGNAGHNGLKSIDAAIGPDYRRIRIGISHPRDTGFPGDVADYVLGRLTPDELDLIEPVIKAIVDKLLSL